MPNPPKIGLFQAGISNPRLSPSSSQVLLLLESPRKPLTHSPSSENQNPNPWWIREIITTPKRGFRSLKTFKNLLLLTLLFVLEQFYLYVLVKMSKKGQKVSKE